ncbi:MAG: hypothetical protein QUV05_14460, partial [Phycisphaerae bacterium]|nr:hypothetical protein [Phycisphaerae bacterium]
MTDLSPVQSVEVAGIRIGPGRGLVLIAGPCVIESREHTLRLAEAIKTIADKAVSYPHLRAHETA